MAEKFNGNVHWKIRVLTISAQQTEQDQACANEFLLLRRNIVKSQLLATYCWESEENFIYC